jgi:hypothetical protein
MNLKRAFGLVLLLLLWAVHLSQATEFSAQDHRSIKRFGAQSAVAQDAYFFDCLEIRIERSHDAPIRHLMVYSCDSIMVWSFGETTDFSDSRRASPTLQVRHRSHQISYPFHAFW